MAGLLDYLTPGLAAGPFGGQMGLLSYLAPKIADFYKNQQPGPDAGGPQLDPMGNFTGVQSAPAAPSAYSAADAMPAGGVPSIPPQAPPQPSLPNPIAIGGGQNPYMMPRLGNADLFEPQQVNTPPNATSAQGQIQQQPNLPPAFGMNPGGFFDKLNQGLQSIGNGGSVIGALTGTRTDPNSIAQQNLTAQYQALAQMVGPQKAMLAVLNPKAGESIFKGEFDNPKTIESVIAGRMADGKGNATDAMKSWLQYQQGLEQAKKSGSTTGEKQAEIAATLPDTLARTEEAIKQISEVRGHSAKGGRTGIAAVIPAIPGLQGKGVDFDERVAQLRSANFLAAAQQMRSLGALSNAEGAKIEGVQARLKQTKDTADFDQALNDMEAILKKGYINLQRMGGQQAQPYQMPIGESRTVGDGVTIRRVK